jgi:ankyrin repeat protein
MGNTQAAALLLDAGANINAAYADALTPLMWAAGQGQLETVKLLISRGANASLKDDRGLTAWDIAKANQKSNVVEYLSSLKK